jgi:hypothetical protein
VTLATPDVLERLASEPETFPGALLLTGASDAALEREARRLAARLLCPGDDPDLRCGSCRRVEAGIHPDLMTLRPEGVGQIRVERVREALVFAAGQPYEAPRRVVAISHADRLGLEAANALLKALEEPGRKLRWILSTTNPEALLPTIRSRTTAAALPTPSVEERRRLWADRGFSDEDARDLAGFADEDASDPAALLEEGRAARQILVAALEEGVANRRVAALVLAAELAASREDSSSKLLAELLADAALAGAAAPPAEALRHPSVAGRLAALARRAPPEAWREAALLAADAPADNRRGNRRLHFEKVLLSLYAAAR